MVGNKNRLYVALYTSGVGDNEEQKYHWGFIVGPKKEKRPQVPGVRYDIKKRPDGWVYEEAAVPNVMNSSQLLMRILVAKIVDERRMVQLIAETALVQNDPNWWCRSWVIDALSRIRSDGISLGSSHLNFGFLEKTALENLDAKIAAGRYATPEKLALPKPTWDLIYYEEIRP